MVHATCARVFDTHIRMSNTCISKNLLKFKPRDMENFDFCGLMRG